MTARGWFAWSAGPRGVWRTRAAALDAWRRFDAACHTRGTSGNTVTRNQARLYECRTRALARTVDVSEVRDGERIVGTM